jgi:formate dehydrogenase subunit delta
MSTELQHLVKMANQIAENFSFHADANERVADHIQRFWAPPMQQQLVQHAGQPGSDLRPEVLAALESLNKP